MEITGLKTMRMLLITMALILNVSVDAQLSTEVSGGPAQYEITSNEVLYQIKIDYSSYIQKSAEFYNNCDVVKDNLDFKYAASAFMYSGVHTWSLYYHSLEGKKCIKLSSFPPRFLDAEEASLVYYVSSSQLWHELPWMAQIKLRYARSKNQICNMAHFHKRTEVKGHVIRYNLCLQEKLVQGKMFGDAAVIAL